MRWRWVAGLLWSALAAWLIYVAVTREFPSIGDYVLPAVLLAMGILVATGRGPAPFVAFLGVLFAGFMTVIFVLWNLSPCSLICPPPWLIAPGAVVTIVSVLAFREMTGRRRQADSGDPPA
jgi:hypothetical protein